MLPTIVEQTCPLSRNLGGLYRKSDRSPSLFLLANVKMIPIHKRPETTFCLNEKFWYPEGQSSNWAVIQGTVSHPILFVFFFFTIFVKGRGIKISGRQRGSTARGNLKRGSPDVGLLQGPFHRKSGIAFTYV